MSTDHFHEKGETVVADSLFFEIGGKGINQAIAARRMGAEVYFLAAVGDDENGKACRRSAEENSLKATLKVKKGHPTASAFILTDKNGENRVTVFRGAELTEKDVDGFEECIASSDILLLQNEVPSEVNIRAIELAEKHSVKVILNPAPAREIPDFIRDRVFLVTPNEQEATGLDLARFQNVVTTLGDKGCLINGKVKIPAIPATPVDTTGAGDTFNGTLAVCIAEGMTLENACRIANTASGMSVEKKHVLASIPTRFEIERRINK